MKFAVMFVDSVPAAFNTCLLVQKTETVSTNLNKCKDIQEFIAGHHIKYTDTHYKWSTFRKHISIFEE